MNLLIKLLLVAGGGAFGCMCRYLLESAVKSSLITWVINTLGSFIMGVLSGWMTVSLMSSDRKSLVYLLLMSGFCGGFSTFAHFSIITVNYFRDGAVGLGLGYIFLTIVAGLACCFGGYWLGTRF